VQRPAAAPVPIRCVVCWSFGRTVRPPAAQSVLRRPPVAVPGWPCYPDPAVAAPRPAAAAASRRPCPLLGWPPSDMAALSCFGRAWLNCTDTDPHLDDTNTEIRHVENAQIRGYVLLFFWKREINICNIRELQNRRFTKTKRMENELLSYMPVITLQAWATSWEDQGGRRLLPASLLLPLEKWRGGIELLLGARLLACFGASCFPWARQRPRVAAPRSCRWGDDGEAERWPDLHRREVAGCRSSEDLKKRLCQCSGEKTAFFLEKVTAISIIKGDSYKTLELTRSNQTPHVPAQRRKLHTRPWDILSRTHRRPCPTSCSAGAHVREKNGAPPGHEPAAPHRATNDIQNKIKTSVKVF
jgi:hypothetical protein